MKDLMEPSMMLRGASLSVCLIFVEISEGSSRDPFMGGRYEALKRTLKLKRTESYRVIYSFNLQSILRIITIIIMYLMRGF